MSTGFHHGQMKAFFVAFIHLKLIKGGEK